MSGSSYIKVTVGNDNSGGMSHSDDQPTPIIKPPELNMPQPQLIQVAKLQYHEFTVKIFTDGLSGKINNSPRFFYEPIVVLDPKSVTIQSQDLSKEDVVSFSIQMWNLEIYHKVLELLRLMKLEVDGNDVSVVPYEDIQLVGKPGSIHPSIKIMEDVISYHRQNEKLEFFLLCDSSLTAQNLADNLRKSPSFLVRKWQLALECRGLALNPSLTDGKASPINRPFFKLFVSTLPTVQELQTQSNEAFADKATNTTDAPDYVKQINSVKQRDLQATIQALPKNPASSNDNQLIRDHAQIQGLTNKNCSTVSIISSIGYTNPSTSSDPIPGALSDCVSASSGTVSMVAMAPAVTVVGARPTSSSRNTKKSEMTTKSSPPTSLKHWETAASTFRPVKEEKLDVSQSKLAVQQPSSSSERIEAVKIFKCPAGARLSWQPPESTAGEITEYTVSIAVKGSSPTQSVESLTFARVYRGTSPQCTVPNSSLSSAHLDKTTKPAIIFRITALNENGYGPPVQVMWVQDSSTTPAKEEATPPTSAGQSALKEMDKSTKSTSPSVAQQFTSSSTSKIMPTNSVDPNGSSASSPEQQAVTTRSTPVVGVNDEPKVEMKSRPASVLKSQVLPVQVVGLAEVAQQPPQFNTASINALIAKAIPKELKNPDNSPVIKNKPVPLERPSNSLPKPNLSLIRQPGAGFISSTLNKKTKNAESGSFDVATSTKFTPPISSNVSTSVGTPVPLNIPHPKVNTGKNTAYIARTQTGTGVAGDSLNTTSSRPTKTMAAPAASKTTIFADHQKNSTATVVCSSPSPSPKLPKPVECKVGEMVKSPTYSSAPTNTKPILSTPREDTRSTQSVCNPANLTKATIALNEVANGANSARVVAAAVVPSTSKKSELCKHEATRYSVRFSSNSFRDDIIPEDVILAHNYLPTGELQIDSVVMVHLEDGLIYTGVYKGKSVTKMTSSISSKIMRITKFGVYPANFTTAFPSTPIGSGGMEAARENVPRTSTITSAGIMIPTSSLLLNAALLVLIDQTSKEIASVEEYLANSTNADRATAATVNPPISNDSKVVIDSQCEGIRYSVDILMVDGSFSKISVLPDHVIDFYDDIVGKCESRIGCAVAVRKPNGCFNIGIFGGVTKVSKTSTSISNKSTSAVAHTLSNNFQLELKKDGDEVVLAQADKGAARVANTVFASQREGSNQLNVPPIQDTPVSDPSGRKRHSATSGGTYQSPPSSAASKRSKSSL